MKIFFATCILFLLSCETVTQNAGLKVMDFEYFSVEAPSAWAKIKQTGQTPYEGAIAIDSKDTLHFDLRWYSTQTTGDPEVVIESQIMESVAVKDTAENLMVDSRKGKNVGRLEGNGALFDTIGDRRAEIIFPRKHGEGQTGIYIDSLWQVGDSLHRFYMHGQNLSPLNEAAVLKALRTLKFHKPS